MYLSVQSKDWFIASRNLNIEKQELHMMNKSLFTHISVCSDSLGGNIQLLLRHRSLSRDAIFINLPLQPCAMPEPNPLM